MDGVCKLCGKHKKLCLSHILPKSFTKRIRDGGEPQVVAVTVDDKPTSRKSNGEHIEHLLCEKCEHLLKINYEDYGTRLFVKKQNIIENKNHVFITNFEYQKYFLFIVSILWRASASSRKIYNPTKTFSGLDALIKPCIANNTLVLSRELQLDHFIKISLRKVIDHKGDIPQNILDKLILNLNCERGDSVDEGLHYSFMVDGFLITASLFHLNSPHLQNWNHNGRLLNRSTLKIPKVSFYEIKQVHESMVAIASVTNPFSTT